MASSSLLIHWSLSNEDLIKSLKVPLSRPIELRQKRQASLLQRCKLHRLTYQSSAGNTNRYPSLQNAICRSFVPSPFLSRVPSPFPPPFVVFQLNELHIAEEYSDILSPKGLISMIDRDIRKEVRTIQYHIYIYASKHTLRGDRYY